MIVPNHTDLGRRVRHNGWFGHVRLGVLRSYTADGFAKVLFDGRPGFSVVTLGNLEWDDDPDARCSTANDGSCAAEGPCMHTAPTDDEDDALAAVGELLGGILAGVASDSEDREDDGIEAGGGSFGGGGASGGY